MTYSPKKTLYGNFKMYEVVKSSTAERNGINNIPENDEVWDRAEHLARTILQPIRDHFGVPFSPSSWYRSPHLEKIICGHTFVHDWMPRNKFEEEDISEAWLEYLRRKSHPLGEAVDIEIVGVDNHDLFNFCEDEMRFRSDQIIAEFMHTNDPTAGWVHISGKLLGNRNQIIK